MENKILVIDISTIPPAPSVPAGPTGNASCILSDPGRDAVYVLDNVANTLMFFNPATLALEKTIFVGSRPNDMDIDKAGDYLYVACWGGRETAVVDLATRTKVRSIFIETHVGYPDNWFNIACGRDGRLYYAEGDQWCSILIVDSADGTIINEFGAPTGSFREPDIVTDPTGQYLYIAESSSGQYCWEYDVSDDMSPANLQTSTVEGDDRKISTDKDCTYVFFNTYMLDCADLSSVVTQFPERIWAVSMDGAYACTDDAVYDSATGAFVKELAAMTRLTVSDRTSTKLLYYDNKLPGLRSTPLP